MSTITDKDPSTPPGRWVVPGAVLVLFLILILLGLIGLGWRILVTRPILLQYLDMLWGFIAVILAIFAVRIRPKWRHLWQQMKSDLRWQSGLVVLVVILWVLLLWIPPGLTETHEVKVCALGFEHPSDGALKAFLTDQARQQAQDYFGFQQVRQIGAAEFSPGENLGEVCIEVTFDNGGTED